jgi:tetratricopeptide (TPR) repeat protein
MSANADRIQLEQAIRADFKNGSLHYLLGADCAQAGEYDRAVSEMALALELDPSLHTARFQLGLLHLTMAQPDASIAVWAPLESQPDESLRHFKRGLEALIRDDAAGCLAELEAGIAANTSNAPLNRDMGMMMEKVREHLDQRPAHAPEDEPVRTDFSAYER